MEQKRERLNSALPHYFSYALVHNTINERIRTHTLALSHHHLHGHLIGHRAHSVSKDRRHGFHGAAAAPA